MFKAANAICHCVYHDRVSVRKSSWNSKCFLLQTQNQFSFWASEHGYRLEGIFKTPCRKLKQDFVKLLCNSSVGWDEHLPFEQISATQSQGCRPMLVSTGLSGNEAYSPLNFLYTWNWSLLKPNKKIMQKVIFKNALYYTAIINIYKIVIKWYIITPFHRISLFTLF